jgi:hypothetical protein
VDRGAHHRRGLCAIGIDPNEGSVPNTAHTVAPPAEPATQDATVAESTQPAPLADEIALLDQALAALTVTPRASLRDAAAALLPAWDAAMEALCEALPRKPGRPMREPGSLPRPHEGTKLMAVLAMLRRPDGATVAQVGETTGQGKDNVRGFFAGLKKKGITIEVAERIRQVGPKRTGSR